MGNNCAPFRGSLTELCVAKAILVETLMLRDNPTPITSVRIAGVSH